MVENTKEQTHVVKIILNNILFIKVLNQFIYCKFKKTIQAIIVKYVKVDDEVLSIY